MRRNIPIAAAVLAGMAVATLLDFDPWVSAQQRPAEPRFAAVPTERGGQDIFGGYNVAAGWPKDLTTLPGHAE